MLDQKPATAPRNTGCVTANAPKSGPRTAAFTLVELLVVISIIVLLIGILLPSLGKSKEHARQAKCLSNNRQQAVAFIAWGDDNKSILPTADQTTRWKLDALYVLDKDVGFKLNTYGLVTNKKDGTTPVQGLDTVWICPSTTILPRLYIAGHATGVLHVDNYMIQTALPQAGKHPWGRAKKPTPTRVSDPTGPVTADHTRVDTGYFISNHIVSGGKPEGYNQSYNDGHATWIRADQLATTGLPSPKWDSGWPWYWTWFEE